MVHDHPLEQRAMELFRAGKGDEARKLQEAFLAEVMNSGEELCSCPSTGCALHGKCVECVVVHRGHGEHLPACFRAMLNRRLEGLSALTEHTMCRDLRQR